jgi:hypothetical protein
MTMPSFISLNVVVTMDKRVSQNDGGGELVRSAAAVTIFALAHAARW